MSRNYRALAKSAVVRAKLELETNDDERLRYAALDLRMAVEALTYERATIYKDDISPKEYGRWQPPSLMKMLVAIDPNVSQDSTLVIRESDAKGSAADKVVIAGTEKSLNIAVLNDHYHALGSYLHMPTMNKLQGHANDTGAKLRARCISIVAHVEEVLSSSLWSVDFKDTTTLACLRCDKTIIRRFNKDEKEKIVSCWSCNARYKLVGKSINKVKWIPEEVSFNCPNKSCGEEYLFWVDEVMVGKNWTCNNCNSKWVFALGATPDSGQPLFVPRN